MAGTSNTVIQDIAGNDAIAFNNASTASSTNLGKLLALPTLFTDNTAPVLQKIDSNAANQTVTLTYSENINNTTYFIEGNGASPNAGVQATAVSVFTTFKPNINLGNNESTQTVQSLQLTVSGLLDGTDEKLNFDGTPISLVSSSGLSTTNYFYSVSLVSSAATVTLTPRTTRIATTVNTDLAAMTYLNTNIDNPSAGRRNFDITSITDSSGAANALASVSFGTSAPSVTVVPINDPPTANTVTPINNLSTTNSQGFANALSIPTTTYANFFNDIDSGNTIQKLTVNLIEPSPFRKPFFIFPSGANSLYFTTPFTGAAWDVYGTATDIKTWLSQPNAIKYQPSQSYTGILNFSLTYTDTKGGSPITTPTTTVSVSTDTVAPSPGNIVIDANNSKKIILSFNEPLNTTQVPTTGVTPASGEFTFNNGNSVTNIASSGNNLILTTQNSVSANDTLSYFGSVTGAHIKDVYNNSSSSFNKTLPTVDTNAPFLTTSPQIFNSPAWLSSSFVLTFNKELADVPWTLDSFNSYGVYKFFSASWTDLSYVNTQRVDIAKSGGSSAYGNTTISIPLTLPVGADTSFQFKYVDPTTANDANALQDLAGNDVGNMVLGAWTNDNLSAVDANFTLGKTVLVVGGQGNDTMTGGLANDTFTWFAGDAGATGAVDIVKSFGSNSSSDKLDISKLLTGYTGGTNLSQWVTITSNATGAPSGVTGNNNTKIVIDVDGNGSGQVFQTIWLEGVNLTLSGATLEAQLAALKTSGVLIA